MSLDLVNKPAGEILKAVYRYRYMTALDVTYLLYSPSSINHVREILSYLSGQADLQKNKYLYRFPLPQISTGGTDKVYTLGTKGRYLLADMGMKVDWYFKPTKVRHLSYGFIIHALTLTRFLVALRYFVKTYPIYKIPQETTCYDLEKKGIKQAKTVIPDAWILVEGKKLKNPILLEIDRGTEYKQQFKQHVKARIEYIQSGAYSREFNIDAVMVIYATTGQLPKYQISRRAAMCRWTLELLEEMGMEEWATIFRFCSFDWKTLFNARVFDEAVWFRPDQNKPLTLLGV